MVIPSTAQLSLIINTNVTTSSIISSPGAFSKRKLLYFAKFREHSLKGLKECGCKKSDSPVYPFLKDSFVQADQKRRQKAPTGELLI